MTPAQKSARVVTLLLLALFVGLYGGCAEQTSLVCRRADGECVLTQERLFAKREVTVRLSDLLGAHEEGQSAGAHGSNTGYNVLDTRRGPIQFEVWGGSHMVHLTSSVRSFLKSPKQAMYSETYDSRLDTFGAASFLLVGALLLFALSFSKSLKVVEPHR